jgi:hypothetical protein
MVSASFCKTLSFYGLQFFLTKKILLGLFSVIWANQSTAKVIYKIITSILFFYPVDSDAEMSISN